MIVYELAKVCVFFIRCQQKTALLFLVFIEKFDKIEYRFRFISLKMIPAVETILTIHRDFTALYLIEPDLLEISDTLLNLYCSTHYTTN